MNKRHFPYELESNGRIIFYTDDIQTDVFLDIPHSVIHNHVYEGRYIDKASFAHDGYSFLKMENLPF